MKEKFKRSVSVGLEDELSDALEKMALEEERPLGVMARILLREAVKTRKERQGEKETS